ncbi:MAG: hypothetical protein J5716_01710 [Alphaproteobacteria bacterium]|nr:hypothetical protein [Alphaproteobacteria bacterium]
MSTNSTLNSTTQVVKLARNPKFRSITDGFLSEPERGFPESITDSSQYESVQSIEARCMRGELMLQKNPIYEFDGDVTEADLDVEEPEYDELTHFDDQAEQLYEELKSNEQSELPTGNKEPSENSEKSEATTLPVDNSGSVA